MDRRFAEDEVVLRGAGDYLAHAVANLPRKVADVREPITGSGRNSGVVHLFGEAFRAALARAGEPVDGVFHGTFGSGDVAPGPVTVADCWQWIPYENLLVVAELNGEELGQVVAEDAGDRKSDRTLWPFEITLAGGKVTRLVLAGKEVRDLQRRFRIAFNTYDAQSGGKRLLRLREILAQTDAKRRLTAIDTRGALLEYLLEKGNL